MGRLTSGRLVSDLALLLKEGRIAVAGGGIIAYSGVMLIVVGLTGSSVIVPIVKHYPWGWVSWPAGFIYLVVLCWLGRCYISSFSIDGLKLSDWAKSAITQQGQFPSLDGRTTVSARVPSKLVAEVGAAAKLAGIGADAADRTSSKHVDPTGPTGSPGAWSGLWRPMNQRLRIPHRWF